MKALLRRGLSVPGVLALLVWCSIAGVVAGQVPKPGTASVSGRVVDGVSNQPIAGAFVAITASGRATGQPTIVADGQGRFVFRTLPAGSFDLVATARGYLAGGSHLEDGMPAPPTTVEVTEGEQAAVTIRLWPPARISGTIVDDLGDPIESAQFGMLRVEYIAGHRRLRIAGAGISDDRGFYTSGRLAPGSYVVAAIMRRMTIPVATRDLIERLAGAPSADQAAIERSIRGSGSMADFMAAGFRVGDFILQPGYGGAGVGPAPAADGTLLAASTLYYPGVPSAAQAQAIVLRSGEHRRGIDLRVSLSRSSCVSGRILGIDGPVSNIGVRLIPEGSEALVSDNGLEQGVTVSNSRGEFTFIGVPSGSYAITAYMMPPAPRPGPPGAPPQVFDEGPTLSGSVPIAVGNADIADVMLNLRKGPAVQGKLVFDGKAPAPRAEQISQGAIRFELADGRGQGLPMPPIRVAIDATGQFQSIGIPGGRYVLRATGFPGWTLESAMLNGRDISEEPLDADASPGDITGLVVTLTDASAGVAGTVRLPSGAVAERATVLVYATDKAHWVDRGSTPRRLLRASTSTTGNFTLTGLPPGDYLVLATTDALPENWSMPEYLAPLSRIATRVSIEKRTTRTVALTSTTLPRGGAQ